MTEAHRNALADEPSPYLRQHAHNPVDWLPWGEAALAQARKDDRPILLSIGYSACHWCHVMAHESFEDAETAALMNRLYVNIKVDREERPDLDRIYQLAHQAIQKRGGGWPLTVLLDPQDQQPYFVGTYFPPEPRHGLPGFRQLLENAARVFDEQRDSIQKQSASLAEFFKRVGGAQTGNLAPLNSNPILEARAELSRTYDEQLGGFGGAPKFPQPVLHEFLLGDEASAPMSLYTLRRMALGGLQDHLAGGFFRYSVDAQWEIPHFEKMLYDNAQLLPLLAAAARRTGDSVCREAAEEMVRWLNAEMRAPDGGYYSALDADSEGHEGLFYTWSEEALRTALREDEFDFFCQSFQLEGTPNFEGRWHLQRRDEGQNDPHELRQLRNQLAGIRAERVRPGLDDKILTAWNGMLAGGMARAGRLLDHADWIDMAAGIIDFIQTRQWRDGRLRAAHHGGRAYLNGYLDDYACTLEAVLELLQARWNSGHLNFAIALADALLAHFEDAENGGFHFTSDDHEQLISRPKPYQDEAVPSGNGVAVRALTTLGHLIGEPRYLAAADNALQAAAEHISSAPAAHCGLLRGLAEQLNPSPQVIIRSELPPLAVHQSTGEFGGTLFVIPPGTEGLPHMLNAMEAHGDFTAYICEGTACSAPIVAPDIFEKVMAEGAGRL